LKKKKTKRRMYVYPAVTRHMGIVLLGDSSVSGAAVDNHLGGVQFYSDAWQLSWLVVICGL
jgi:hypothetical protein